MNNSGLKNGLNYGGLVVLLSLILYFIGKRLMFSLSFGFVTSLIIPIIFMVLAVRQTRSSQGGILSFGEALSPSFLTYVVGSFIITIFTYLMTSIIDPSLLEIQKEVTIETLENALTSIGAPEEQLEEMLDTIRDQGSSGIGKTLIGWAVSLIWPGFIIAAIISLIMKRKATA